MLQRINRAWDHGKKLLGSAYNHAVTFAKHLDHGVHVAKKVYGILQPTLGHNKAIMDGFSAYDRGRQEALGIHTNVAAQYHKLSEEVPELGF